MVSLPKGVCLKNEWKNIVYCFLINNNCQKIWDFIDLLHFDKLKYARKRNICIF